MNFSSRTRELPGHYPFSVQKMFIEQIIKQWQGPAIALCKTVHASVLDHLQKLVSSHFGNYGQGHLETRIG